MQKKHEFMQMRENGSAPMRLAILGNSGSGKSTLARSLAQRHGLALLDLDTVAWEPGQVAQPRDPQTARAEVQRFCQTSTRWVVEGCYASLVQAALAQGADERDAQRVELLFLNPGEAVCLDNCRLRPWEPHKYASKARQDENLPSLLSWVSDYYRRDGEMSLRGHQALFDAYNGPKRLVSQQAQALPVTGQTLRPC